MVFSLPQAEQATDQRLQQPTVSHLSSEINCNFSLQAKGELLELKVLVTPWTPLQCLFNVPDPPFHPVPHLLLVLEPLTVPKWPQAVLHGVPDQHQMGRYTRGPVITLRMAV